MILLLLSLLMYELQSDGHDARRWSEPVSILWPVQRKMSPRSNCRQCRTRDTTADGRVLSANPEVRSDSETAGDGERANARRLSHCLSIVYLPPTICVVSHEVDKTHNNVTAIWSKCEVSYNSHQGVTNDPNVLSRTIHEYRILPLYDIYCTDTCTDI
jgi:hypothetical protein